MARLARIGGEYGCASTRLIGAIVSHPADHARMNDRRRCAYCRSSSAQMMAAPNAAALNGLIAMVSGRSPLDVQLLGLVGAIHDESETRGRVLAHQLVH